MRTAPVLLASWVVLVTGAPATAAPPSATPGPAEIRRLVDPCTAGEVKRAIAVATAGTTGAARTEAARRVFQTRLTSCLEAKLAWAKTARVDDEATWARARYQTTNYLQELHYGGAILGVKPAESYLARCDRTTMTQAQIDAGELRVVAGAALFRPAEFELVLVSIQSSAVTR